MSALYDFYKKAKADPAIMADIKTAKDGLGSEPSKDAVVSAVIGVAKKHGVTLSQADFKLQAGSLEDDELRNVAGGCYDDTGLFYNHYKQIDESHVYVCTF